VCCVCLCVCVRAHTHTREIIQHQQQPVV